MSRALSGRDDLLRALRRHACALCLDLVDVSDNWINAFGHETNADPETRDAITAARGFCASHTRTMIGRTDGPFLLTGVYADVAAARLADLAGKPSTAAPCPVCRTAEGAVRQRFAQLIEFHTDQAVHAALANSATCLPHLVNLTEAAPGLAGLLADRTDQLNVGGPGWSALIGGATAHDGHRRTLVRSAVEQLSTVDVQLASLTTGERAIALAGADCCAVCRSSTFGAVRFLHWLSGLADAETAKLESNEFRLCGAHLIDLESLHPDAAARIGQREIDLLRSTYERLVVELGPRPNRKTITAGLERAQARPRCPACHAADVAEHRTRALLIAALADRATADALHSGHGLCIDHATGGLARQVLTARLGVLQWELEETLRRRGWRTRHEPRGPEGTAWHRAPTWLTPGAYLGLPAQGF